MNFKKFNLYDSKKASDSIKVPDLLKVPDSLKITNILKNSDSLKVPDSVKLPDSVRVPDSLKVTNLLKNSDSLKTTNSLKNSDSFFSYLLNIIRYILIFYLISYIILTILNQLKLLPNWLEELFTPYDIINKIKKNNQNNQTNKNNQDNKDNNQLATSINKEETPLNETIDPSKYIKKNNENIPKPDKTGSVMQSSKIANKSGYCYIGEDRGFRSCIKIEEGDECMSGNIFTTEALCINPNLRN